MIKFQNLTESYVYRINNKRIDPSSQDSEPDVSILRSKQVDGGYLKIKEYINFAVMELKTKYIFCFIAVNLSIFVNNINT